MENFIVSARKYRPASFDTVVGQLAITSTLRNAIVNHQLAQAYLFTGPRGVGKTTCARIFAKTINCLNLQPNAEPCNECESCKAFNAGRSLNIHELDAASNNSVDDIRGALLLHVEGYGDVRLSASEMTADGSIEATVRLTNSGRRDGVEVVQLYIRDRVGSSTRPVQELKGFQRVALKAGESRDVSFTIDVSLLKYYDFDLRYVAEPGEFDVMIGGASDAVKQASFTLK